MILHASAASSEGATQQPATMVDIMSYMNSRKDLPEYCQCRLAEIEFRDTFRNESNPKKIDWPPQFAELRKKWINTIGVGYNFLHHYCWGITRMKQAFRMIKKSEEAKRESTFKWALQEFQYVQDANEPSFPFWRQLFIYESQIYMQLGQPAKAQRALQRAAEMQKRPESHP